MLRKPLIKKPASSSPNLEQANELVAAFGKMQQTIAETARQIEALTSAVVLLSRQVSASREKPLPELNFTDFVRDPNTGALKGLTARPKQS